MDAAGQTICAMCGTTIPAGTRTCLGCGERLPAIHDRRQWPILVRMGLWMIQSRTVAWAWFWFSASLVILPLILATCLALYFKDLAILIPGLIASLCMGIGPLW